MQFGLLIIFFLANYSIKLPKTLMTAPLGDRNHSHVDTMGLLLISNNTWAMEAFSKALISGGWQLVFISTVLSTRSSP